MRPILGYDTSGIQCNVSFSEDTIEKWKIILIAGEFTCCGGYSFTMGYTDWKHTILGSQFNSVPDSCCLKESTKCGANIFAMTDPKKLFSQIHTHGCIAIMQRRLEEHVVVTEHFEF